mmetsp:Transcript_23392/g.61437  ORF Transcript_23392/g.61437 Transcript_23392/m.61437 type:complete len:207 (+) Transcript_23392:2149-2769(+)
MNVLPESLQLWNLWSPPRWHYHQPQNPQSSPAGDLCDWLSHHLVCIAKAAAPSRCPQRRRRPSGLEVSSHLHQQFPHREAPLLILVQDALRFPSHQSLHSRVRAHRLPRLMVPPRGGSISVWSCQRRACEWAANPSPPKSCRPGRTQSGQERSGARGKARRRCTQGSTCQWHSCTEVPEALLGSGKTGTGCTNRPCDSQNMQNRSR